MTAAAPTRRPALAKARLQAAQSTEQDRAASSPTGSIGGAPEGDPGQSADEECEDHGAEERQDRSGEPHFRELGPPGLGVLVEVRDLDRPVVDFLLRGPAGARVTATLGRNIGPNLVLFNLLTSISK